MKITGIWEFLVANRRLTSMPRHSSQVNVEDNTSNIVILCVVAGEKSLAGIEDIGCIIARVEDTFEPLQDAGVIIDNRDQHLLLCRRR